MYKLSENKMNVRKCCMKQEMENTAVKLQKDYFNPLSAKTQTKILHLQYFKNVSH